MTKTTCYIYRSTVKELMYLYLNEKDGFDAVPEALLRTFGVAEFSMKLELTADQKLANAETPKVLKALESQGFYLQMPPKDPWLQDISNLTRQNSLLPLQ